MSMKEFDPKTDGWFFKNWGETDPFKWDLFRDTYLGINPKQDCVEAPLDCSFFELFKICAEKGNCGGMSVLALALSKYGGYMGFCSPANFYTGGDSTVDMHLKDGPYRDDLRRAINILQARQFNADGIRNFLDILNAGKLNDAVFAFGRVKELLGAGDYPILSIATGVFGEGGHSVIPYAYDDGPGWPKYLYIWDPNFPHNSNPGHYDGTTCKMTINGPTNWIYASKGITYKGTDNGWCFAVPMSIILHKARHPMSVGMVFNDLMTLFVTGSGAAVGQISDDYGRRLYTSDVDIHTSGGDFETDPDKRLLNCGRWPWYGKLTSNVSLPEVYFLKRLPGESSRLKISLFGTQYRAIYGGAGNLVSVEAKSKVHGREAITFSGFGTSFQSLEVTTSQKMRNLNLRQTRVGTDRSNWRAFEVRNLEITKDDIISIDVLKDFSLIAISGGEQEIPLDLRIEQTEEGRLVRREETDLSIKPGNMISFRPGDWSKLKNASIKIEEILIPKELRGNRRNFRVDHSMK